jgi:hypothetical protein
VAILIRFAPRPGAAIDPRRDQPVPSGELRIGRSPRCGLRLPHASIRYEHAVLRQVGTGVELTALDGATIEGGSAPDRVVLARQGDAARIGPYSLELGAPGPDGTPSLVVTPQAAAASTEAATIGWYQRAFDVTLPNIRLMSFGLSVIIAALFFILPLSLAPKAVAPVHPASAGKMASLPPPPAAAVPASFTAPINKIWNVGVISNPHSGFGGNCGLCHKAAFLHVPSSACLDCHRDIGQHADPVRAPSVDLNGQRCETCHREHKGLVLATKQDQQDCAACHDHIHGTAPASKLRPATDFGRLHPDFAPALVTDAVLRTTAPVERGTPAQDGGIDPGDHSGLRFTHARHLALAGLRDAPGDSVCAKCHTPGPGGIAFEPVQYDTACAVCHTMPFEPKHPEWHLPHGHPGEVESRIAGFYARAVLAGEEFPAPSTGIYAAPGAPPPAASPQGTALVAALTEAAMASSIKRSDCGECHVVDKQAAAEPGDRIPAAWRVAPVYVPQRYLPRATFSHAAHITTPCASCHTARTSNGGVLALLPGISTCRECHAGQAGAPQRVASTCVSCHWFHDPKHPLIPAAPVTPIGAVVPAAEDLSTQTKDITQATEAK